MAKPHGNKGRKQSPEHIAKRVAARKANGTYTDYDRSYLESPEYKAQLGERTKALWAEGKFEGRPKRKWTEEQKRAASEKRKRMWAEGRYDNRKPSTRRRVSKMERALAPYLEALGYRHTEGRECFIACEDKTRVPDFVDIQGRRVFEFFGNFWHHPEDEQAYIRAYAEKGWECTVLWEDDLMEWLGRHEHLVTAEQHEQALAVARPRKRYARRGNPQARHPVGPTAAADEGMKGL